MASKPIHLSLYMGPAVPLPAPQVAIDSLASVTVLTNAGETASGFDLTFNLGDLGAASPLLQMFQLNTGKLPPIMRTVIAVTVNGIAEVLIDGMITQYALQPGTATSPSMLTLKGKDLTTVMGWIDFSGIPYPAMPDFARVALVLAKYAPLGVIPKVIPSVLIDIPLPTQRIPRQQGKDLAYIKSLAEEVGYTFYLEPGPTVGTTFAYWGPEIKVGIPQPALTTNMDALTNVESLTFRMDSTERSLPVVFIQEQNSKAPIPIPVPDITPLNPPLGLVPPIPTNIEPVDMTSKYSPVQAALIGIAKAARSADVVTADGSLDVLRYGRVLKARQLVGVRGAGLAYDGLYYVKSVTHKLGRGEYKQDFTLVRNGLISTLPAVPV